MGTIRLGKRTEHRMPLIRDFVPLAGLDQMVFGAWDPISDTAYEAAIKCGVLDRYAHIEPIAAALKEIAPMTAVFDQSYVRRLDGANVKSAATKRDLAEAIRKDIRDFKATHSCDRIVVIWCASTETYIEPGPGPPEPGSLRSRDGRERRERRALDALRVRGDQGGSPLPQRRTESHHRHAGDGRTRPHGRRAHRWQGLQDGADPSQDRAGADVESPHARASGLVLDEHPR